MVRENQDRLGWCMPAVACRFGQRLMSQQAWCWGRDIKFPQRNLLMRYGFQRHRDPLGRERATCYRLDRNDCHVALWGFGMFYGERRLGGLFLDRFDIRPAWAPVESLSLAIHWPSELPTFSRPRNGPEWCRARCLWQRALRWIARYEIWIRNEVGLAYRQDCVNTWLRPFVPAGKIIPAWRFLSRRPWEEVPETCRTNLLQYELAHQSP